MKIAFNPSTVEALTTPPNNKDITFDLRGRNIFARGVKFCGTDTNTWRDIKINNVSIGSNILDLRNGSNTTLTNTNGVVTINSTQRPVVDNLTSDSTTSSLSANQGRVLKALIDGKSDSGHNHDDRYLRLTGGWMSGDINFGGDNRIQWGRNTDSASISFKNDGDGDADSYMSFVTSDNGNEYFRWSHSSGSTNTEWMSLRSDGLRVGGTKVSLEGHYHNDLYYTKTEVNNKLNGKSDTGHTHDDRYLKLTGGTMTGIIRATNRGGTWISGRDHCLIRSDDKTSSSYWSAILAIATVNGYWTLGHLGDGGERIGFNYDTDADYNAGRNNNHVIWLPTGGAEGTLALTSDIPSSLKNPHALTISLNGTSQGPYDGSAAKNINITPSSIGAATSDHTHDNRYLKLTGGTMQLGEGLKFHADENYFGTYSDARIISLLDGNGKVCDGGLIIDERGTFEGKEYVTELLRIRDSEFKWRGSNILHSGNSNINGNTITINGSSLTVSKSDHTHSNYVTALGTSDNYLTWTKNGSTNNITVPYATTSSYLTSGFSAPCVNKWDCNAPDRVVYSDYGSDGRLITNHPSGWHYGTLLELGHTNYRGINGILNIQLMWDVAHNTTLPGTLWFRGKDEVNGWAKSWAKVITDQNISSILSNYYTKSETDGKYVTLTTPQTIGGSKTFTTGIKFNTNKNGDANLGSNDGFKLFYNETSGSNFPGNYYNVASFITGYTGFQLACYGGYDQALKYRHREDNGTWHPWKTLAFTTDIPSSLKNPYSLTTFGVVYDGSTAKTVTTSTFISQVTEGTATVTDGTMFITSYASNSGFADTNAVNVPYKRKAIHLWNYIKAKTDSLYYTESEVNNLLSKKLNISDFNWTNLPGKLVAGDEFNIVNAGFTGDMWFNYVPINDRSKTATINSYIFGNGAQGYASVQASGFVKTGSSSSYVLLGDGGHQTISSLSVSYANSAGNADYIRSNELPTPANNTVKAYKDSLVKFFKNHTSGIGANVSVSTSIISNWSNDTATCFDSSYYSVIKISGYYDGVTYGQFLLSSFNLEKVGIVGRNNDTWSKIKWLAYEDQIPTDNKQLTNGAGYITSAGSCAYATSAGNADTVDGYHATAFNDKPWGYIPVINLHGYMDIGKHLEFHYDNTTGSDYSTILRCTGNYANTVNLPSESGTLALTKDVLTFSNENADYLSANFNNSDFSKKAASKYIECYDNSGGWWNWMAGKFMKAGSSDAYVLLGGGGHKALSNFASSSHSHNYAANENYGGFTKSGRLPISGFYQSNESESGGNAPWSGWMHLINCQHNNTGNNYALQIVASFFDNNTFKIRVTDNDVNNDWRDIIHSGNIGSQTVANAYHLRINAANTWSTWYWSGQSGQPTWLWGSNDGTNMYVWNPSNFRVASATKLQTPRSIWGQSFDGTNNINGTFYFTNGDATMKIYDVASTNSSYGNERVAIQTSFDGQDPLTSSYPSTYPDRSALLLQPRGGNIGIGTTSPSYKLHVAGDIYTTTGFKKNGSSDSYVLLGGGGHKLESSLRVAYASNADTIDGYHVDDILPYGLENLCIGASNSGGQTILNSDGSITTSGNDSDTYFYVRSTENLIAGQIYTVGFYVTGVPSGNTATWSFRFAGQGNNKLVISITSNGWCWGTGTIPRDIVAGENIIFDDAERGFYSSINISKFVIVKGKQKAYYTPPISKMSVNYANSAGNASKVIVHQNTTADANYPLVWSNQNNTNTVTENQLYKSWSDLYYNPKNKRLTVGGSVVASSFVKSDGTSQQLLRADGGIATFNWSGQSGQPTWLWGGNNEHSYYVYNPSNFRVAYATSAGSADTLDGVHLSGIFTAFGNNGHNITATIGGTTKSFLVNWAADSDKLDGYHASNLLTSVTNTNNGISVTVGGTTKSVSNISVNYASSAGNADTAQYLRSLGNQNCQTGRTQNYGDVYTYNTYDGNTGSPTTFTSVIGFGRGIAGTVEIAGGWDNTNLYWRSLRDCCEDWHSWRTVLDSNNYTEFINNYYWANVKISTTSSTTTSPTVSNLTATSSIRMGNILLQNTDEINNSANGDIHLNYRNSGNVSLCQGGGSVGIGTTSPTYKLDVNGQVRASGFHHSSMNSDNYILLAGGGYKSFGGDSSHPIFLGYLDLNHGSDGTVSSSFYCLGYSVPFTYTRGGNYCKISIPDTTHQAFYIKAATASVNYSGGGMDTWTGNHRGAGAWWLHCYAPSSNEVRVKGFHLKDTNNDSWWGGNPLWSDKSGANRITVCIFGYVTFR